MMRIREISDELAEEEVTVLISKKKSAGKKTIDDLDIVEELGLPIEQVDKVLIKLQRGGVVNERS